VITCPRILIAGSQSGVGKTSTSLGLVSALSAKGLKVQTFKVGPDFLDPTYLALASGRPCYNLDGWMMGEEYVRSLFASATADADIAVIEGVMGLFDGFGPDSADGSAAQIAVWLGAPVLLVLNAAGASRSLAAMARGFAGFDENVAIAGVIANNCGSENHAALLAEALRHSGAPALAGGVIKGDYPQLPSRHLGLVSADTGTLKNETLQTLAAAVARRIDLDRVIGLAKAAPPARAGVAGESAGNSAKGLRLGVARDRAFHFYYQDNLDALAALGFELAEFSPIADRTLPERLDALYLGGGYPELNAEELSANKAMIESIRAFAARGRPVYAECGGLIYLSQGVEDHDGNQCSLAGLLPAWAKMKQRFASLGYVEVDLTADSLFGQKGAILRGHKFHYSELVDDPAGSGEWKKVYELKRKRTGEVAREGYQRGNTLASYVHLHLASRPRALHRLAKICREEQTP